MPSWTVPHEEADMRLDRVLEHLLEGMGLRGRRRLCSLGLALVNGRPAKESFKVRAGDVVTLTPEAEAMISGEEKHVLPARQREERDTSLLFPEDRVRIVKSLSSLVILYKPAGMHTEPLSGKPGSSLQSMLPELLRSERRALLLNRLDYPTSGLVTAALNMEGVSRYEAAQEEGRTEKRYLALLEGEVTHGMLADQRLLLKNRERVLVELARHPDPRRHTVIAPLAILDGPAIARRLQLKEHGWTGSIPNKITLAGCTILKGARHQIRAHCSALGFPLLGDARYGAGFHPEAEEAFFLHHAALVLPFLRAFAVPPWLGHTGSRAAESAERWMKEQAF